MGVSAAKSRFLTGRQRNIHGCFPPEDKSCLALRVVRIVDQNQRDICHICARGTGFNSQTRAFVKKVAES